VFRVRYAMEFAPPSASTPPAATAPPS